MEQVQQQSFENVKKGPIVAVLLFGAFVAILNETLLNTALPQIINEFKISPNKAQWLTTAFLLTNGVMIPISAFFIEKFPMRKLFLTAMCIFTAGTLVGAISTTFTLLLVGRVVQAAGAGIMMPLMMTAFLTIFPPDKRGAAMGMAGLVISFAPAIGPTLSGFLVEFYSWRLLFYVVLPFAVIEIVFAALLLKNVTNLTNPKVDVLSIFLSSVGFGGLLYGFSIAGEKGWSSLQVETSLAIGAVVLVLFIWRQLSIKTPMLEFRVFKFSMFSLTLFIGMVVIMAMLGAELLLPIYMQNMRGFTALESGLVLLPGAIVMGIMSPITGMVFDKIGARWMAVSGLGITTITTFLFTDLNESTSFTFITVIYAIRMLGLSLAMMPVMTAGLNQLPQRLHPHGTAMANTLQQIAGSIGSALLVTVMTIQAKGQIDEANGMPLIHGLNAAFMVATGLALLTVIMSFFIKRTSPQEESDGQNKEQEVQES
ncbi:EmrB/QacA subfamily drug resistance transporter [Scopulibacillus darangshiensis]|uniref:EmrB/QacA subfamily drug resistance transporter n=1 Tax=Scopulibacillus darangshiensis TaxID=442528 RepID=A0A4R2P5A2_9BACL|nr:MDR family MFS transporter [Scopulibacillus darangshiensis]TCP29953.1 EmrB/QacA subfamily drug resistance transporter [Scopulibacillus darangshiensis]